MTSFTATIFIGALVTIGLLLISLLISLMVMLQSCESKNSGVIGFSKSIEDYSNCKIFALHAELNSLEANDYPPLCKDLAIWYIREGQYARDLNATLWMVESYFSSLVPLDDDLDVVLMDIDDIFPSKDNFTSLYRQFSHNLLFMFFVSIKVPPCNVKVIIGNIYYILDSLGRLVAGYLSSGKTSGLFLFPYHLFPTFCFTFIIWKKKLSLFFAFCCRYYIFLLIDYF